MKNFILSFLILTFGSTYGQKAISVEDFTTKNTFAQRTVSGINWMKDGKFYSTLTNNKVIRYDITSGQEVETLVDGSSLSPAVQIEGYWFSSDESKLLLATKMESIYRRSYTAEFFIYDIASRSLQKLSDNGRQSYASFSPDGSHVAFVRDNNLFYVSLADKKETQITNDG